MSTYGAFGKRSISRYRRIKHCHYTKRQCSDRAFPKLEDAQNKIVAEFKARGISDKELSLGQWTIKRTDSFYLKDDPTLPRYNADGSIAIKTHNIAAMKKWSLHLTNYRSRRMALLLIVKLPIVLMVSAHFVQR